MNPFRDWLQGEVARRGWTKICADGGFTTGALQGWLRGAFPGPTYQEMLAKATEADLDTLRLLVWQSEKLKDQALALEVELARKPFRPRNGRGAGAAAQTPSRRPRKVLQARSVEASGGRRHLKARPIVKSVFPMTPYRTFPRAA